MTLLLSDPRVAAVPVRDVDERYSAEIRAVRPGIGESELFR